MPDRDTFRRVVAFLTWKQHGGSGTNLGLADVMEMEWEWVQWWAHWVDERRQLEVDALNQAHAQAHAAARRR